MHLHVQLSDGLPFDLLAFDKKEDKKPRAFWKVVLFAPTKDSPVARAVIYYMYTREKYRGKGCAKFLLTEMKKLFGIIVTQESASSKTAVSFLKKNGFANENGWLVWKSPTSSPPSESQRQDVSLLSQSLPKPDSLSSMSSEGLPKTSGEWPFQPPPPQKSGESEKDDISPRK